MQPASQMLPLPPRRVSLLDVPASIAGCGRPHACRCSAHPKLHRIIPSRQSGQYSNARWRPCSKGRTEGGREGGRNGAADLCCSSSISRCRRFRCASRCFASRSAFMIRFCSVAMLSSTFLQSRKPEAETPNNHVKTSRPQTHKKVTTHSENLWKMNHFLGKMTSFHGPHPAVRRAQLP